MKKLFKNKKALIIISIVLILLVYYYFFSKKGVEKIANTASKVTNQPQSPLMEWKRSTAVEFTKDVWFNNQNYIAQVKNIDGVDTALLSNEKVVFWNGSEWISK